MKMPLLGELDERQVWMREVHQDALMTGKAAGEIQGLWEERVGASMCMYGDEADKTPGRFPTLKTQQ